MHANGQVDMVAFVTSVTTASHRDNVVVVVPVLRTTSGVLSNRTYTPPSIHFLLSRKSRVIRL